jgi:hypothetical protein
MFMLVGMALESTKTATNKRTALYQGAMTSVYEA